MHIPINTHKHSTAYAHLCKSFVDVSFQTKWRLCTYYVSEVDSVWIRHRPWWVERIINNNDHDPFWLTKLWCIHTIQKGKKTQAYAHTQKHRLKTQVYNSLYLSYPTVDVHIPVHIHHTLMHSAHIHIHITPEYPLVDKDQEWGRCVFSLSEVSFHTSTHSAWLD